MHVSLFLLSIPFFVEVYTFPRFARKPFEKQQAIIHGNSRNSWKCVANQYEERDENSKENSAHTSRI
jgi:hypothetical protein